MRRVLPLITICLLFSISFASAADVYVDKITTNPNPPWYSLDNSHNRQDGPIKATFEIGVHVVNFPPDGHLSCKISSFYGSGIIDSDGWNRFTASLDKYYYNGKLVMFDPTTLYIIIYDSKWNVLYEKEQYIKVYDVKEIPEFPTIAAPVAAILGLIVIFGRKM